MTCKLDPRHFDKKIDLPDIVVDTVDRVATHEEAEKFYEMAAEVKALMKPEEPSEAEMQRCIEAWNKRRSDEKNSSEYETKAKAKGLFTCCDRKWRFGELCDHIKTEHFTKPRTPNMPMTFMSDKGEMVSIMPPKDVGSATVQLSTNGHIVTPAEAKLALDGGEVLTGDEALRAKETLSMWADYLAYSSKVEELKERNRKREAELVKDEGGKFRRITYSLAQACFVLTGIMLCGALGLTFPLDILIVAAALCLMKASMILIDRGGWR